MNRATVERIERLRAAGKSWREVSAVIGIPALKVQVVERMAELRAAGATWSNVAEALGMPRSTVHHVADRAGLGTLSQAARSRRHQERSLRAASMRRAGMTWRSIGVALGVSTQHAQALGVAGAERDERRRAAGMI